MSYFYMIAPPFICMGLMALFIRWRLKGRPADPESAARDRRSIRFFSGKGDYD